jgi:hypothetical protein
MRQTVFRHHCLLLILTGLLCPPAARAQGVTLAGSEPAPDCWQRRPWASAFDETASPDSSAARVRANRVQLFRITPGFLTDPVGLDADDPAAAPPSDGADWLQVSLGNDNPFFDFRRPGDPGGVGYYKVHTQLQLFGTRWTNCAVNLQAVTPAGLDQDGVADGLTVLSPSLSVYHELADGTAFQGFIGRHLNVNSRALPWQAQGFGSGPVHRQMQYGFAVQRPVWDTGPDQGGSVYLFLEALGRYRYDANSTGPPAVWEMVPGVHWRVTDSLWLTGGVLMPVNAAPTARDPRLWQFTCSIQF